MKNNSEPVLENHENMKLVITFLSLVKCFSCDTESGAPEAFQDWYGESHPISRPDDGGTEGPERGAKHWSAEGGRVWGEAP